TVGGFSRKKTLADEAAFVLIDDLLLASEACTSIPAVGTVVASNGSRTAIPATGFVDLPSGSYFVEWRAGTTTSPPRTFTVVHQDLADDLTCCPVGTNVI